MKYYQLLFLAIAVFLVSLVISLLARFPFFLLFLPFPPLVFNRKGRTDPIQPRIIERNDYCGYCGRQRNEDWIACPYCGNRFE
ncbi:MAG: hypothetical protein ACFFD4_14720 [Candidatus Odinarchaeota archaeon]